MNKNFKLGVLLQFLLFYVWDNFANFNLGRGVWGGEGKGFFLLLFFTVLVILFLAVFVLFLE